MTRPAAATSVGRQALTFTLRGEEWALPVERVHEVLEMGDLTRVPGTPAFVLGVVDLRGRMVPVLDIAARLGLGGSVSDPRACVLVVDADVGSDIEAGGPRATFGLRVDAVGGLVDVGDGEPSEAPDTGGARGAGDGPRLLDLDAALRPCADDAANRGYNERRPTASDRSGDGKSPEVP
jgi:purine-binding chemotaxis protein CheW